MLTLDDRRRLGLPGRPGVALGARLAARVARTPRQAGRLVHDARRLCERAKRDRLRRAMPGASPLTLAVTEAVLKRAGLW